MELSYGFVRSTDTWGVNSIPWEQAARAGLDGLAFAANDPHLDQAIANARAQHRKYGIWIPAGGEGDPVQYAQRISALAKKYGPDILIPNIEFTGKGYQGSAGWNWNDKMMTELQRLGLPKSLAVAVLPNQQDFNYGAYTSRGAHIMPETFGANTGTDLFDPEKMRQVLLSRGVPASQIDLLLAPGQVGKAPGGLFTIDDISDWSKLAANALAGNRSTATSPARAAAIQSAMPSGPRTRTAATIAAALASMRR